MTLHRIAASLVLTGTLLFTAGCTSAELSTPTTPPTEDVVPGQLTEDPVELVTTTTLQVLSASSEEITYTSTSGIDGSATTVSGVLFVPNGEPPPGGWPIASIAHPTAGLRSECAPSSYPGLLGSASTVAQFLSSGFVVVMSDYQGLGTPGPHPYLDPTTAAYNVIDAVRAAREAVPEASDAWFGYGVSQGGQAVWAANEQSAEYGTDLRLLGTISVAPVTDLRPLVDAMQAGTLTIEQKVLLPMVLAGMQIRHPELRFEDYLHGTMAQNLQAFLSCADENSSLRGIIAEDAPASDFVPSTPRAADQLREWFGEIALPRQPTSVPMLVAYGDADTVVLPQWTAAAIRSACSTGAVIGEIVAPGQGHGTLNLGGTVGAWIAGQLAAIPAPNACVVG